MATRFCSCLFRGLTTNRVQISRNPGVRLFSTGSVAAARYIRELPFYPDGFEVPPQIYVSDGTVHGKIIEKPDFVQNEVPQPKVAPEIAELLQKTRHLYLDGKEQWPTLTKKKLKAFKIFYVAKGYYWPEEPEKSLALIRQKPRLAEKSREARKKLIEEKMKEMPRLIEEYRIKVKERRLKKREAKEKDRQIVLDAKRRGINPKQARAMAHLMADGKERKKVASTKKGYRRKTKGGA